MIIYITQNTIEYILQKVFLKLQLFLKSLEKIKLKNICKIIMKIVHSIIYLSIIYIGILKFKI